jgi:hypothetical protein
MVTKILLSIILIDSQKHNFLLIRQFGHFDSGGDLLALIF